MHDYKRKTTYIENDQYDLERRTSPQKPRRARTDLSLAQIRIALKEYKVEDIYLIELQCCLSGISYYMFHDQKPDVAYIKLMERMERLVERMQKAGHRGNDMMASLVAIIEGEEDG